MSDLSTNLLEQAKEIFENFRETTIEAAQVLYRIKSEEAWKGSASSFGEFVEGELGISQGFASKLVSVWTHYTIENDVPPLKLAGVDYEKLYLAAKLSGGVDEQIEKARTLSRSELREEQVDDGHEHSGETVMIHKCCGMRIN